MKGGAGGALGGPIGRKANVVGGAGGTVAFGGTGAATFFGGTGAAVAFGGTVAFGGASNAAALAGAGAAAALAGAGAAAAFGGTGSAAAFAGAGAAAAFAGAGATGGAVTLGGTGVAAALGATGAAAALGATGAAAAFDGTGTAGAATATAGARGIVCARGLAGAGWVSGNSCLAACLELDGRGWAALFSGTATGSANVTRLWAGTPGSDANLAFLAGDSSMGSSNPVGIGLGNIWHREHRLWTRCVRTEMTCLKNTSSVSNSMHMACNIAGWVYWLSTVMVSFM
jgi:hypothetical protein